MEEHGPRRVPPVSTRCPFERSPRQRYTVDKWGGGQASQVVPGEECLWSPGGGWGDGEDKGPSMGRGKTQELEQGRIKKEDHRGLSL